MGTACAAVVGWFMGGSHRWSPPPTTFADPLVRVGVLKKEVVHEWVPIQASDHPFNPRRWELHACMYACLVAEKVRERGKKLNIHKI